MNGNGRENRTPSIWEIKTALMWAVLLEPQKQEEQLREKLVVKLGLDSDVVEKLMRQTGFGDPGQRSAFRQSFGHFLCHRTGLALPFSEIEGAECTVEQLREHMGENREIAQQWNQGQDMGWFVPYRLINKLLKREIMKIESRGRRGAERSCTVQAVQEEAKEAPPEIEAPAEVPEQALLERGRRWLKDLHLLLGVKDPAATELALLQEQVAELGRQLAELWQKHDALKKQSAAFADREAEVNSRWAHLETLASENRRLEQELAQAREETLADFFQDLVHKNPPVEEVLLGMDPDPNLGLAGLVEFFRLRGLRPGLPPDRLGEKVTLDHRTREFRPLDFIFDGDREVEAKIAHPGVAFNRRLLVLPGVRLTGSDEADEVLGGET